MSRETNYDLLIEINNAVNRIENKFERRFEKLESDVDKLKDFQSRAMALAGVIGAFVSLVASWLWNRVTNGS